MPEESPFRALLVVSVVALVSSSLVSGAVLLLRPVQLKNQLLERGQHVVALSGRVEPGQELSDEKVLEVYRRLDTRIADLDAATFVDDPEPRRFDQRRAAEDPELSVPIPEELDWAGLGRRSRYQRVYLVWENDALARIILPIRGSGMWSMLYGYLALESDLNTIAAATFYEQNETPGLGDQITRADWLGQWQGRRLYDRGGEFRFGIGPGQVEPGSEAARYRVDALSGATVTAEAVSELVRYWMGPHGYKPLLERLRERPPLRAEASTAGQA